MAIAIDLIPHGRAENSIVLNQQDSHGPSAVIARRPIEHLTGI
jgi:hypothetical protein